MQSELLLETGSWVGQQLDFFAVLFQATPEDAQ